MTNDAGEVTILLQRLGNGDESARDALTLLVYNELRKIAAARMSGERPDHTLQPTALVHEAFLKLVNQSRVEWRNRAHFYGVASETMRRVLVDHARARLSAKRGSGVPDMRFEDFDAFVDGAKLEEILLVHEAIEKLKTLDEDQAAVVRLHYFGGFTLSETASGLGLSQRTAERSWALAKAWLQLSLRGSGRPR